MKNLAVMIVALALAGCGDVSEVTVQADGSGDAGAAGAGGGTTGGAGGESSARGGSGGQGGFQGLAGAGPAGSGPGGTAGAPVRDAGAPACPPSDAACPAGTTCMPLSSGSSNWGCFCPGYPDFAYCTDACIDLRADPKNCGSCRHACGQGQGCQAGACR